MRSSISAQSWESVPPAPELTVTIASPESYSPEKRRSISRFARRSRTLSNCSWNSPAIDSSSAAISSSASRSSTSATSLRYSSSLRWVRECSAETFAACSWSSQKPVAPMSFSSASRRSLSEAGSKVVREQLQLVTERPEVNVGRVGGHVTEASGPTILAVPNIKNPEFDDSRDQPGFRARRAKVGFQGGAVKTGLSYWEVEPGEAAYPYHAHLTEEEIIVVVEGRPSLRTPAGWRELEQGEVVVFPTGEKGAHQIVNKSDAPIRFLAFSNSG